MLIRYPDVDACISGVRGVLIFACWRYLSCTQCCTNKGRPVFVIVVFVYMSLSLSLEDQLGEVPCQASELTRWLCSSPTAGNRALTRRSVMMPKSLVCMCMCVCARARACVYVCMCVCVRVCELGGGGGELCFQTVFYCKSTNIRRIFIFCRFSAVFCRSVHTACGNL